MIKRVFIPAKEKHGGIEATWVELSWKCPKCGKPRGEVKQGYSFDGSHKLYCDRWKNPCGHVDKYETVREEAKNNGLNN